MHMSDMGHFIIGDSVYGRKVSKINIDFESHDYLVEEKETYQVGEEINEKIKEFIVSGIEKGDLRNNLEIMPTIFNFWGMLSGIIQLAANKEEYIKETMGLSKSQFLEQGFQMLYYSIACGGNGYE